MSLDFISLVMRMVATALPAEGLTSTSCRIQDPDQSAIFMTIFRRCGAVE